MNKKLIAANLMLAVLATACGDSTYAPNGNYPYGQGTINGLPPQQINPMFQNQPFINQPFANQQFMNQGFDWQSQQQQMILQNQLRWQAQMQYQNTGCMPQITNTGCFPQPRPSCTTTTTNYYSPNRNYIVSSDMRLYSTGRYILVSRGRGRNKCYSTVPVYTYRSNRTVNVDCITCNDSSNSTSATTTTTTTTTTHGTSTGNTSASTTNNAGSQDPVDTTVVPAVSIIWTGDEAKELFKRMNVAEKDEGNRMVHKRGGNLHCQRDKHVVGKDDYACFMSINVTDALVLRQSKPHAELKSDEKGFFRPEAWTSGENLTIGGGNRGADEAILKFEGNTARDLFANMKGSEASEKHEETKNDIIAKTSGQLKCYRTINTTNNKFYCEVKLQPATGSIQDDYTAAAPSSAAEATENAGKEQPQNQTENKEVVTPPTEEKPAE